MDNYGPQGIWLIASHIMCASMRLAVRAKTCIPKFKKQKKHVYLLLINIRAVILCRMLDSQGLF